MYVLYVECTASWRPQLRPWIWNVGFLLVHACLPCFEWMNISWPSACLSIRQRVVPSWQGRELRGGENGPLDWPPCQDNWIMASYEKSLGEEEVLKLSVKCKWVVYWRLLVSLQDTGLLLDDKIKRWRRTISLRPGCGKKAWNVVKKYFLGTILL